MSESKVLYIAFHYPPVLGSSGVHRSLAFTRYLATHGWHVTVLTASLKAYERWSENQFKFIPENVDVLRGYGRDTSRHFAWRGKYAAAMALPDNWQSWIFGGVITGLWRILTKRPKVIVSTYPLASAHVIGYFLHRLTGVPWVADLRDPMAQEGYPSDKRKKRFFEWIESKIVKHCKKVMVTTPGAKALYQERFPEKDPSFWQMVPNGFDAELFDQLGLGQEPSAKPVPERLMLLHSGVIYPHERDPSSLFKALSELKAEGLVSRENLYVRLRSAGHDEIYSRWIAEQDIADIVELMPTIDYQQALEEIYSADGLLIFQAANCDYQIPAKAYEYIKVKKPVFALTTEQGDTGTLLRNLGVAEIAPLDDKDKIKSSLLTYLQRARNNGFAFKDDKEIDVYSRQYQAGRVKDMLDAIVR